MVTHKQNSQRMNTEEIIKAKLINSSNFLYYIEISTYNFYFNNNIFTIKV